MLGRSEQPSSKAMKIGIKTQILISFDPGIPAMGIYPKEITLATKKKKNVLHKIIKM